MPADKVIPGPYIRDILAQPTAVIDTVAALRDSDARTAVTEVMKNRQFRRIVLTGMGSSLHALHPLTLRLIERGHTAMMVETSELLHFKRKLIDSETLLVAVSQSGRSAETVHLLDKLRRRCPVIGVTNTADSPLARRSDAVVPTRAGEEFSVSSRTYVASLAALAWLGDVMAGRTPAKTLREMSNAAASMSEYLGRWKRQVAALQRMLADIKRLVLAGRGPSLAAAATGGLIIKESAHFHSEGMSAAAFRHGPLEMTAPGLLVVVFEGEGTTSALNHALARDVRQAGGKTLLIGPGGTGAGRLPEVGGVARPLLEILPVQMISLALAALAGREAGRFEHITKVTSVE